MHKEPERGRRDPFSMGPGGLLQKPVLVGSLRGPTGSHLSRGQVGEAVRQKTQGRDDWGWQVMTVTLERKEARTAEASDT